MTSVLLGKPIDRLVENFLGFIIYKLMNSLPAEALTEWSTSGIKATFRQNSCSSVLKLLELLNGSCTTATPY